jgi:hypothetical protein
VTHGAEAGCAVMFRAFALATCCRIRHTTRMRLLPRSRRGTWLLAGAVCLIGCTVWYCWPGQFSHFNLWLIRPGIPLERVEWLIGGPGERLTEEQLPILQGGGRVVSGESFYRWRGVPKSMSEDDFLIVSVENGVVKEVYWCEVPLF